MAERGASDEVLAALDACLAEGDVLFEKRNLDRDDEQRYGEINARFHDLVIQACRSPWPAKFIDRLDHVPFVAPSVIVFDQFGLREAFDMLHRAHGFHHAIVSAIRQRDGARAEFPFREPANHQRVSMFEQRRGRQAAD